MHRTLNIALVSASDLDGEHLQSVHVRDLARSLTRPLATDGEPNQVTVYTRRQDKSARGRVRLARAPPWSILTPGQPARCRMRSCCSIRDFADGLRRRWTGAGRPDIVHAHGWIGGLAACAVARELGIPFAQSYHGVAASDRRAGRRVHPHRDRLEKAIGRDADIVLAGHAEEEPGRADGRAAPVGLGRPLRRGRRALRAGRPRAAARRPAPPRDDLRRPGDRRRRDRAARPRARPGRRAGRRKRPRPRGPGERPGRPPAAPARQGAARRRPGDLPGAAAAREPAEAAADGEPGALPGAARAVPVGAAGGDGLRRARRRDPGTGTPTRSSTTSPGCTSRRGGRSSSAGRSGTCWPRTPRSTATRSQPPTAPAPATRWSASPPRRCAPT